MYKKRYIKAHTKRYIKGRQIKDFGDFTERLRNRGDFFFNGKFLNGAFIRNWQVVKVMKHIKAGDIHAAIKIDRRKNK